MNLRRWRSVAGVASDLKRSPEQPPQLVDEMGEPGPGAIECLEKNLSRAKPPRAAKNVCLF